MIFKNSQDFLKKKNTLKIDSIFLDQVRFNTVKKRS